MDMTPFKRGTQYGPDPPARPKKRRRTQRRMVLRRSMSPVYAFVRGTAETVITGNAAYIPYQTVFGGTLDSLINYTDFTNLFDQYCIDTIELRLFMRIDPGAQAAGSSNWPRVFWYRDFDDQALASMNDMRENQKTRIATLTPGQPVVIRYKPNVLSETYRTAISTGYVPKFGQFISTTDSNLTHYGIKLNIDNLTNTNYRVDIETRYWIRCKSVK